MTNPTTPLTYPKTSFAIALALVVAFMLAGAGVSRRLHTVAPFVVVNLKVKDGVHMVIENPLARKVTVTIHCGGDAQYDETQVAIFPHTREAIDIETTPAADYCTMARWE